MSPALPKLSYVLLSHNREKYIRAAIESAFAQDYEGELEYIFSDDCSTDRTFEIIKECVAAYKGNRRVVITQTPRNLHLAGHTNHAVQFVESDWVIRADDDDYSAIDRCSIIGRAIAAVPEASFVATRVRYFESSEEEEIRKLSRTPTEKSIQTRVLATEEDTYNYKEYSYKAWNIRAYRKFPPLHPQGYYVDDFTCYYRCKSFGKGVYVESAPMVFGRADSDNMSSGGVYKARSYKEIVKLENFNNKYYNLTLQPIIELRDYIAEHTKNDSVSHILNELDVHINQISLLSTYWNKGTLNRFRIRQALGYSGLFSLVRCLPLPLFAAFVSIFRILKQLKQNIFTR